MTEANLLNLAFAEGEQRSAGGGWGAGVWRRFVVGCGGGPEVGAVFAGEWVTAALLFGEFAVVFDDSVVGGAADLSGADACDRVFGVGGDVVDVAERDGFGAAVDDLAVAVADFDDPTDCTGEVAAS